MKATQKNILFYQFKLSNSQTWIHGFGSLEGILKGLNVGTEFRNILLKKGF